MPQDLDSSPRTSARRRGQRLPARLRGRRPRADRPGRGARPQTVPDGRLDRAAQSIVKIVGDAPACRQGPGRQRRRHRRTPGRHQRPRGRGRRLIRPSSWAGSAPSARPGSYCSTPSATSRCSTWRACARSPLTLSRRQPAEGRGRPLVAGFPRNGGFRGRGRPGPQRHLRRVGEDIYGGHRGSTARCTRSTPRVEPGNSGGPLLLTRTASLAGGRVRASRSTTPHTGYALTPRRGDPRTSRPGRWRGPGVHRRLRRGVTRARCRRRCCAQSGGLTEASQSSRISVIWTGASSCR